MPDEKKKPETAEAHNAPLTGSVKIYPKERDKRFDKGFPVEKENRFNPLPLDHRLVFGE